MSEIRTSGSSWIVPSGVNSLKIWAVGAGGGGAGSTNVDAGSGGAGGAGGVCYKTFIVNPGDTISYSLGTGGAGGVDAHDGNAGSDTTVTVGSVTITANGGAAGRYNNTGTNAGGSFSGGDSGAAGGTGGGAGTGGSFDEGGAGGGAIGTVNGASGSGNAGKIGAQSADTSGLFAILTEVGGFPTTSPGAAGPAGSLGTANVNNGGGATGFGCGGGGAGYFGGNGGNGLYGGGGGGASGYSAINMTGGTGGAGVVVFSWSNNLLYISGAESGNVTLEPTSNAGTSAITSALAHSGTYCYQINPTTSGVGNVLFQPYSASTGKTAAAAQPAMLASFYFRAGTLPASNQEIMAGFFTGSVITTSVSRLVIKSTGVLVVLDNTGATIGTGTTTLSINTWYRIDYYANITTGAWALAINGINEISGTGATFGATNIGNFAVGKTQNLNSQTVNFYYDDIWLDSQNFAPPNYVIALDKPTANGTTMSWTGGTGASNYTQVNPIPAVTSTYVEDPASASTPVIAEFAMQTFAQMGMPVGSAILGVHVFTFVADIGSAVTNTFKQGLISGATTSINTTNANTTAAFVNFGRIVQNDPNTGAAWTQSGIESMQYYAQEATASVNTGISAALIMVAYIPANSGFFRIM